MKIDCHLHTSLCGHAVGNPVDYIPYAKAKGINLLTFTCHIPMASSNFGGSRIRMSESEIGHYRELVAKAAALGKQEGIEVLCGIEAEIFPVEKHMQSMDAFLETQAFDFILGSLHHQLYSYQKWLAHRNITDDIEIIDTYFKQLAEGVASGRYHSIAHPDVIRIYGTVEHMEPSNHEESVRAFFQAVLDADKCIEVNTSGLTKGVYKLHPDPLFLQWACKMGVKLTIGSDSHHPASVGQKFETVLPLLQSIGFQELHYHRKGERIAIPIESAIVTDASIA